jgi:PKD repeat protein
MAEYVSDSAEHFLLCTFRGGDFYWIAADDGEVGNSGNVGATAQGVAYDDDTGTSWLIGSDLRRFDENGEEQLYDIPSQGYALAYDEVAGQLWGGSEAERLWKLTRDGDITKTYSFNGAVYGLAHDGTDLWVGTTERRVILRVDPATGEIRSEVDYPIDEVVYDLAFTDGALWLLTDGSVYRTNITGDSSTDDETSTPTGTAQLRLREGGDSIERNSSIPVGLSRMVEFIIRELDSGFAGAEIVLEFPEIVRPKFPEPGNAFEGGATETEINGQRVRLKIADLNDVITATAEPEDKFVLGSVRLEGVQEGTGTVSLVEQSVDADDGSRVELSIPSGYDEVTVVKKNTCPTVDGTDTTDPDDDGLCEDLNGNERVDFDDVTTFFEQLESNGVQNDVSRFDFNANGRIDFDDVTTLFERVN